MIKQGDESVSPVLPLQCLWPKDFPPSSPERGIALGHSSWKGEEGSGTDGEV